ncbi:glycosyltransferase family 4 protein [Aquella oligotrophica]|uniref:glycosyltransferase family 4 protein n=1 Tax=Aquella oligotrophica TaxID=2067065 RepID=UPI001315484B|nr:glycosyltransferase family 4 protein [Aquella oligotrophica]
MKKIIFIDNTAHHVYGQLHLMKYFLQLGYEVIVAIPMDSLFVDKLKHEDIKILNFNVDSKSINPLKDCVLFLRYLKLFYSVKPELICSFTIKPNLYGSLAAKFLGLPIVANVTGLGYVFIRDSFVSKVALKLYRFCFKFTDFIFCQNHDDLEALIKHRILSNKNKVGLLPGSGVNLKKFPYVGIHSSGNIQFMYSGRLLWDKGIRELISAFRIVRQKYPFTKLIFIGNYFPSNPAAISPEIIQGWQKEGLIEYKGMVDNVFDVMKDIDCVILPSYREGMPRSLLEASSIGKPIITVDSVGCKDVVEDGITGYMAKVADVETLVIAMSKFIELPFDKKLEMGKNGRAKMEREFDQQIVIDKYVQVVNNLLGRLVD